MMGRVVAEEKEGTPERDAWRGNEAESLGGSQAALSVSVAAQSGLRSPQAMKIPPQWTTSHSDHSAFLSSAAHPLIPTPSPTI